MKKIIFAILFSIIMSSVSVFAQFGSGPFGDISGSGSGLEDCTESGAAITCANGFNAGASADPKLQLTPSTDNDTRFYACIDSDAGNDDDDVFNIGDGTVCGTNSFMKIETDGDFQTLNSVTGINDSNTGMFFPGTDVLDFKAGGTILLKVNNPGSNVASVQLNGAKLTLTQTSETCPDSGDGNPGSLTVTPGDESAHRINTVSDANGCTVGVADTSAVQGDMLFIYNNTSSTTNVTHQDGVIDLGSTVTIEQDSGLFMIFDGAEYIPLGGKANIGSTIVTGREASSASVELRADDNDNGPDKWTLQSTASDNDFDIINNATTVASVTAAGNLSVTGTITSSGTDSLGWSIVDGTDNTACTAQCTSPAVIGFNITAGEITGLPLGPSDAAADICLCAGGS